MTVLNKKFVLFSKIENRDGALKLAKETSLFFFFLAGFEIISLLAGGGYSSLMSASLFAFCAFRIWLYYDKYSALILLLLCGVYFVIVIVAVGLPFIKADASHRSLTQDIVGDIFILFSFFTAIRAFEATSKLQGRFSLNKESLISSPEA